MHWEADHVMCIILMPACVTETRYTFPDVTVSGDPRDQPTTEQKQVDAPRIVIEVLSDSTEGRDRLKKANIYRACPSIQEYVLIATKYQAVEVQRRVADAWTLHLFGAGDVLELASINVSIPVTELYKGTTVLAIMSDQDE